MINLNKKFILSITFVSALGGLLFGYDWVVIGGAKPFYERFFDITSLPHLQGWAMSSALIGCLFGALFSGFLSDRLGRKIPLIIAAFLFVLSAIGSGASNTFSLFIIFRLVGGLGIGLACFVLTYTFPLLNKMLNISGTFWLYSVICISGFFFIFRKLPETKGKTLEEVEEILTGGDKKEC
jgi:MFS family permease